jgi:hypothetical protein
MFLCSPEFLVRYVDMVQRWTSFRQFLDLALQRIKFYSNTASHGGKKVKLSLCLTN